MLVCRGFFMLLTGVACVALAGAANVQEQAATPPRGWNSYDSYTWKVTEKEFLANCEAVAKKLLPSGYEYCVVDYLWFQDLDNAAQNCTKQELCDPITKLHIDEYGRLVPAPDRWPSTVGADGKSLGFAPIAEKVHKLGLKFGIHVMRGISIAAVESKSPILGGGGATAADIGMQADLCPWWKGVMSVDLSKPAGQAYYDSLYSQYQEWGVDFVKNDCVFGNQFVPDQIKAQSKSIETAANKSIVYSLSPGAGVQDHMEKPEAINAFVNLYRITGDDWDTWKELDGHFKVAAQVANASLVGTAGLNGKSWPDLDMLPLGVITSPNSGKLPYKNTSLTHDQQLTQMTLWSIARSPLMFGGDATQLDEWTTGLLTNTEVLQLNSASSKNHQVSAAGETVVWVAVPDECDVTAYVALFNRGNVKTTVSATLAELGIAGKSCNTVHDVWTGESKPATTAVVKSDVPPTGVVLLSVQDCD